VEVAAEQRRQRGAFVHSSRMLNNVEHPTRPTFTAFTMLWYQIFSLKDTESMNFKRKACSAVLLELRKACSNLELY
jgi:hypothetical protein